MISKFCIILFFLHSSSFVLYSQNTETEQRRSCLQKIFGDKKKSLFRKKNDKVTLAFFQDFSDSVRILLNDSVFYLGYIIHDSTIKSSNFTGFTFTIKALKKKYYKLTIEYLVSKKYLTFQLKTRYPLYTIHSNQSGKCLVSARRKYKLEIQ